MKSEKQDLNEGISLIVLVITIIVIIILATALIITLSRSGILNKAEEAAVLTEIVNIEDSASLIYMDMLSEKYTNGGKGPEFVDIVNELVKRGHKIETVVSSGVNVTDIMLDKENIVMAQNDVMAINVTLKVNENGDIYYIKIRDKYYKLINVNGELKVERTPSNIDNTETLEITASVTSGNTVTIRAIKENEIEVNSRETKGESIVTVTYGKLTKTCIVNVIAKPTENTLPTNNEPTFSTDYGRIDVIWLDTNNNVKANPNAPNLYSEENALEPVTWSKNSTGWSEDTVAQANWYNYSEIEGLGDNITSKWANAKNSDGSYFVWIPRYAYRITYYENDTSTIPLGYYDGNGLWNAENAEVSYAIDSGVEMVEHNGYKYIVHPSFETNFDNGGWDKDLSGFWIAKYEMSRADATVSEFGNQTVFKSIPNVVSSKFINIDDTYQYSKVYDNLKESHLIKNSEWGAVAYLTQSKYGRNGHEIDMNNSTSYVTGNGGGGVGDNIYDASGITNAYDTDIGAKASTTGNIYGVYDMNGGACEYTAGYNEINGIGDFKIINEAKNENGEYISTKYITKYVYHFSSTENIQVKREVSKIGDSIKEVSSKSEGRSWYNNYSYIINSAYPFFIRGGTTGLGAGSGIFYSYCDNGKNYFYPSFRIVLAN